MRDILIDYSKYGIVFKEEDVGKGITMESAYNEEGNYIGDRDTARNLVKMGIKPYAIKKGGVCCIGFNEEEQKWYGWSHRAIYGFGIGSVIKKGDAGYEVLGNFKARDLDDAKLMAKAFAKAVS